MAGTLADADAWKRLVLQSMVPPRWLQEQGPYREIVLSTRVRFLRNLKGFRFPHRAPPQELREVLQQVKAALLNGHDLNLVSHSSPAERDYLVACRLASPDFDWQGPGRALLVGEDRSASIMVNEEDHLRIQALAAGWNLDRALHLAEDLQRAAEAALPIAHTQKFGYLAASAVNSGDGLRYSAMFHLIGLASSQRLPEVLRALHSQGLVTRGLFGERSRAIGAFAQVSSTAASIPRFTGACGYLIDEESKARRGIPDDVLAQKARDAAVFVEARQSLSLADALRALAWIRWSREAFLAVDQRIPELALLESLGDPRSGRARASLLRTALAELPTSAN